MGFACRSRLCTIVKIHTLPPDEGKLTKNSTFKIFYLDSPPHKKELTFFSRFCVMGHGDFIHEPVFCWKFVQSIPIDTLIKGKHPMKKNRTYRSV